MALRYDLTVPLARGGDEQQLKMPFSDINDLFGERIDPKRSFRESPSA